MKIKLNIVILFTHFFGKKPKTITKELNLCPPSSGHSGHFFMTIRSNP